MCFFYYFLCFPVFVLYASVCMCCAGVRARVYVVMRGVAYGVMMCGLAYGVVCDV